jgi:hypothetical protein
MIEVQPLTLYSDWVGATLLVQPALCLITKRLLNCGIMQLFHLTRRKYGWETRRTLTNIAALFTDLIKWIWNKVGAPDMNVEEENVNLWSLVASNFGYQWTPCCEDHLLLWILQQKSVLMIQYLVQILFHVSWDGGIIICSEAERIKWLWHILRSSAKNTETLSECLVPQLTWTSYHLKC